MHASSKEVEEGDAKEEVAGMDQKQAVEKDPHEGVVADDGDGDGDEVVEVEVEEEDKSQDEVEVVVEEDGIDEEVVVMAEEGVYGRALLLKLGCNEGNLMEV